MNRKQRRSINKKYKGNWQAFIADQITAAAKVDPEDWIKEGEKVKLDVERITRRGDYAKTQEEYRAFVEANADTVFTAHLYRKKPDGFSAVIQLVEDSMWLFWYGDLIRVKSEG